MISNESEKEIKICNNSLQHIVSVTAIEFCEIYILNYLNLRKYVQINETIMQKLTDTANERMEMILKSEEEFEKKLKENIPIEREHFPDDESN